MNRVSVRNASNPMPTGQGEVGTKLLSPFEDGLCGSTCISNLYTIKNKDGFSCLMEDCLFCFNDSIHVIRSLYLSFFYFATCVVFKFSVSFHVGDMKPWTISSTRFKVKEDVESIS